MRCRAPKTSTTPSRRRAAFENPSWSKITPHARSNYLLKIADAIAANMKELAAIQTLDMSLLIAQSRALVAAQVDVFRYYAGWPTKIYGKTMPSDRTALTYTSREPLGVVGAIIPWNGPMLATSWKIAPALACGNTVVFKAAEVAPLVSLRLPELIQETGLPDGVLNMITGKGNVVGQAIVEHLGINKDQLHRIDQAHYRLRQVKPSSEIPSFNCPFNYLMVWHPRLESEELHVWFRNLVRTTCKKEFG